MRRTLPLLLLVAACSSGSDGTAAPSAPPSASTPPSASAPTDGGFSSFTTPSGNIACGLSDTSAACEIREHSWKLTPKPADCEYDWTAATSVAVGSRAELGSCQSDTVFGADRVLAYGQSVQQGQVECTSTTDGVTCTVPGHSFFLSRGSYRLT